MVEIFALEELHMKKEESSVKELLETRGVLLKIAFLNSE